MNASETKPWLDRNGKIYSDEKLTQLSRTWDAETWEQFLQCTISGEKPRKAPKNLKTALYERADVSYDGGLAPELKTEIHKALMRLPRRNRAVIKGIYWESLTEREVARRLRVSHSVVRDLKKRTLRKFKRLFDNSALAQTYFVRSAKPSTLVQRSKHEEIFWTYKADLRGGVGL